MIVPSSVSTAIRVDSRYGENMPGELSAKANAPEVLEKQLRRRVKKGEYGIIAISTSTKPYQRVKGR